MGNAKLDGVDDLEFLKNYAVRKCGQLYRGDVCGLAHCPTTWTHNKEDAPLGCVPQCGHVVTELERVDSAVKVYFVGEASAL